MNTEDIKNIIIEANNSYRSGNPIMDDQKYDDLLEEYKQMVSESEYDEFRNSLNEGANETTVGDKIKFDFIVGSLEKIKNTETDQLTRFLNDYVKSGILNISAKVDGISSVAKYHNGTLTWFASRGDGYKGKLFTEKAPYIKGLPPHIDYNEDICIRGELVILSNEDIDSETNRRNICAGYMNSKTWSKDDISKISFIPYTILNDTLTKQDQFNLLDKLGFNTVWNKNIEWRNITSLSDTLTEYAKIEHEYACDGLVMTDCLSKNVLDEYKPKNARAFKINELNAISKVVDVVFDGPTKDGFFVPIICIDPVEIGGAVISRASGHNIDNLKKLGIKYGSVVEVNKANDIIPYIVKVISNENTTDIEYPTHCTCCGSELVLDGVNLRCKNDNCEDKTISEVETFISNLEIENASFKTLKNFGITTIEKLLSFRADTNYKNEIKLENELKNKLFNRSKKDIFCSLNMKDLGKKTLNLIVDYYGWDKIESFAIDSDPLTNLPSGVGDITMNKFLDSYKKSLGYLKMITEDFRYSYDETKQIVENKTTSNISFCFTGTLNTMGRKEASQLATKNGYEVKTSVSKGLTYLVQADKNSQSTKTKKAISYGTKILSENEFIDMMNGNAMKMEEL